MDENELFEVEDKKHVNHMFTVTLSDLGITRKIMSGVPAMEMTNLSSLPPTIPYQQIVWELAGIFI